MTSRFNVGIGSGATADVCHCAASSAPDGHIHRHGEVLCLHKANECADHCPARIVLRVECSTCGSQWRPEGHQCANGWVQWI